MAALTTHFALQKLLAGEPWSTNGQKFTWSDRDLIDALLYLAAEGHHHSGVSTVQADPATPPSLALVTTAGALPPGSRVWFKYTWVNGSGLESAPSPEAYIDTPAPVAAPGAPTLAADAVAGTLEPGGYYYALSAYTDVTTAETTAPNIISITVTAIGEIVLTLPTLPSGATGFNVYRRKPGESGFFHLASIDMSGGSPPIDWTDDGTGSEDCNRGIPNVNTTRSTNSVTVTIPAPPAGFTWRLYRTLTNASWDGTLLHWVVEETTGGSGIITPTYDDVGGPVLGSSFPVASQFVGSPPKVDLHNAADVTGALPPGRVSAYPVVVTFGFTGPVEAMDGKAVWVNEFPQARIMRVRAQLGRGSSPQAQSVIADVKKGSGRNPVYTSVFSSDPSFRPTVGVGNQIGDVTAVFDAPSGTLGEGDSLVVDIIRSGGGANPTDHDLTVTVYLMVASTAMDADTSFVVTP